ncbi:hypothetical protein [uncultured Kordia sp.]|uniref:hypothetical protein n=1 Tax=uncultured Kordia sp. TaxID=507699 RepID=UPI002625336E|nr:hypothetical protein [uncultured Kordia sp.]
MKNFNIIPFKKFQNSSNYQLIEDGIYNDLNDVEGFSTYRTAVAITFEKEKLPKQAVEKQLESYFVYIEEALNFDENKTYFYVIGGELEDLQNFKSIIQK